MLPRTSTDTAIVIASSVTRRIRIVISFCASHLVREIEALILSPSQFLNLDFPLARERKSSSGFWVLAGGVSDTKARLTNYQVRVVHRIDVVQVGRQRFAGRLLLSRCNFESRLAFLSPLARVFKVWSAVYQLTSPKSVVTAEPDGCSMMSWKPF